VRASSSPTRTRRSSRARRRPSRRSSGPPSPLDIRRLYIDPSGRVAWLQRDADPFGANVTDRLLTFLDATSAGQLDAAAPGVISRPALRGGRLSWLHGGVARSVLLAAPM
jgi:hypothetical protein